MWQMGIEIKNWLSPYTAGNQATSCSAVFAELLISILLLKCELKAMKQAHHEICIVRNRLPDKFLGGTMVALNVAFPFALTLTVWELKTTLASAMTSTWYNTESCFESKSVTDRWSQHGLWGRLSSGQCMIGMLRVWVVLCSTQSAKSHLSREVISEDVRHGGLVGDGEIDGFRCCIGDGNCALSAILCTWSAQCLHKYYLHSFNLSHAIHSISLSMP